MTCENTTYFKGQGSLYIASRTKAGAINGDFLPLGDVEAFQFTSTQNFVDEYESCSGQRALVAHEVDTSDYNVSINAKSFSPENLARALYGDVTAVTGSTVSAEAATWRQVGGRILLAHPNVSAVTVEQTGSPSTVPSGDYEVDAEYGSIKLLSSANLVGAAPWSVTVDYTYGAYSNVEGLVNLATEYAIRFNGINTASGENVVVDVHRVYLNLAETLDLIQQGAFGRLLMSGKALADTSKGTGLSQYIRIRTV